MAKVITFKSTKEKKSRLLAALAFFSAKYGGFNVLLRLMAMLCSIEIEIKKKRRSL